MKLVYNSIISKIESNLTSSNIGARKNKAPRDHLFVLYSVINETLRSKDTTPLDLVFLDIADCSNSLRLQRTLLDLHSNGIESGLLNVIHKMTEEATIEVKTSVGTTKKVMIKELIMQGETLSSILCTSSVDKISKDCDIESFKYRNKVVIPKMGFVDDLLDINKCGKETKQMNE